MTTGDGTTARAEAHPSVSDFAALAAAHNAALAEQAAAQHAADMAGFAARAEAPELFPGGILTMIEWKPAGLDLAPEDILAWGRSYGGGHNPPGERYARLLLEHMERHREAMRAILERHSWFAAVHRLRAATEAEDAALMALLAAPVTDPADVLVKLSTIVDPYEWAEWEENAADPEGEGLEPPVMTAVRRDLLSLSARRRATAAPVALSPCGDAAAEERGRELAALRAMLVADRNAPRADVERRRARIAELETEAEQPVDGLAALEAERARLQAAYDALDDVAADEEMTDPDGLYGRICAVEAAIARAPARTLADVAVKLRRLIAGETGDGEGDWGDGSPCWNAYNARTALEAVERMAAAD